MSGRGLLRFVNDNDDLLAFATNTHAKEKIIHKAV